MVADITHRCYIMVDNAGACPSFDLPPLTKIYDSSRSGGTAYHIGDIIIVGCVDGFELASGHKVLNYVCLASGAWLPLSPITPQCVIAV